MTYLEIAGNSRVRRILRMAFSKGSASWFRSGQPELLLSDTTDSTPVGKKLGWNESKDAHIHMIGNVGLKLEQKDPLKDGPITHNKAFDVEAGQWVSRPAAPAKMASNRKMRYGRAANSPAFQRGQTVRPAFPPLHPTVAKPPCSTCSRWAYPPTSEHYMSRFNHSPCFGL